MRFNKQLQISFLSLALLLVFTLPASAQTVEDLRGKISNKTSEITKIEEEIAKYQKEIDSLGGKSDTLKNSIRKLNATRRKLQADIQYTQLKINSSTSKIEDLVSQINAKDSSIKKSNESIIKIIQRINEAESSSLLEIVLSNDTFSTFLDDIENLKQLQSIVSQNLKKLKVLKEDLENIKIESERQKRLLLNSRSDLSDRKKIAENNKREKARLLSVTKNKESNYKKLVAKKKAQRVAFQRELLAIESQLRAVIDPNSIPKKGLKIFSAPLADVSYKSCYDGSTKAKNCITQYFGNTPFAKSGAYKGKTHNGMDFRARTPQKVRAVLGGTVVKTNNNIAPMCQYGKWVVVKHNNGLTTLYAHMSIVKVKAGQEVNTGDIVGYSGNSGYSIGPHLHLTTYASQAVTFKDYKCKSGPTVNIPVAALNAYLNPLDYL